jgi:hypothetical protein
MPDARCRRRRRTAAGVAALALALPPTAPLGTTPHPFRLRQRARRAQRAQRRRDNASHHAVRMPALILLVLQLPLSASGTRPRATVRPVADACCASWQSFGQGCRLATLTRAPWSLLALAPAPPLAASFPSARALSLCPSAMARLSRAVVAAFAALAAAALLAPAAADYYRGRYYGDFDPYFSASSPLASLAPHARAHARACALHCASVVLALGLHRRRRCAFALLRSCAPCGVC